MTFHILRIESVYHAIKTGQGFPAYIYDKLLEGYGYGAGIFYPDILLLPCNPASFYGIVTSRSHEGIYFPVAVTDLLYIIPGRKSNWKKSFCGGLLRWYCIQWDIIIWKIYTDGRQWEKLSLWHSFLWYFWHCMIIQNGKNGEKGCYVWYFPVCCSVTRSASCYVLELLWYGC